MRSMVTLLCIACAGLTVAHGNDSTFRAAEAIQRVYVAAGGEIHIVSGGMDVVAPKEKGQVDCSSPKLAADGHTRDGWSNLKTAAPHIRSH